jgi:hypothetical protein
MAWGLFYDNLASILPCPDLAPLSTAMARKIGEHDLTELTEALIWPRDCRPPLPAALVGREETTPVSWASTPDRYLHLMTAGDH